MAPLDGEKIVAALERLFGELIAQQRQKVLADARRLDGRLTEDDIAQPQDFPPLAESPEWNYQDGLLAGFQAAQAAMRATLRRLEYDMA